MVANLLNNAAKYTPMNGHIELIVVTANDQVFVKVMDNGAGMTAGTIARVFDMFEQGEEHLDMGAGGLGIGLSLVKKIAELHGGNVRAASDGLGLGSQFVLTLPIQPSSE